LPRSRRQQGTVRRAATTQNEDWKKIYADYCQFRAESNLWFRFTEAKFDSFMQAQKL